MRIKSIELINVRSYPRTTLELSPKINLLIGVNNSGKSSIIKSLLNLQYKAFEVKDIRSNESYAKIFTKIVDIDENDNLSFYDPKHDSEFERAVSFTLFWGLYRKTESEEYLYANSKYKITTGPLGKVKIIDKKNQEVGFKQFRCFSDRENENNFIYPFLAKRKTEFYDGQINQEQSFRVLENLRNLAAKIQKISNPSHVKNEEFLALCDDILGFRIGVISTDQNNASQEPGIYVSNTSMIPLKSMGDGVANIVGFIVTLLTEDNKLFLIEELENDIHPKALKQLLSLIKSKADKNQFVISTHSQIVLKYLGIISDTKIFYTEWIPKNVNSNVPTSNVKVIANNPKARIELLEKLGYDLQDFELYDAYLILEESSAERIIRDFLIPNFVPTLYNKLKTIAARGASDLEARVIDFHRLFVFIHTSPVYTGKAWVIADGDPAGGECIGKLREHFHSWSKDHFINLSKANFEEYYPAKFKRKVNAAFRLSGDKKREAKKKLLNEVMEWSFKNRDEAINQFRVSAGEIIEILNSINKKINT